MEWKCLHCKLEFICWPNKLLLCASHLHGVIIYNSLAGHVIMSLRLYWKCSRLHSEKKSTLPSRAISRSFMVLSMTFSCCSWRNIWRRALARGILSLPQMLNSSRRLLRSPFNINCKQKKTCSADQIKTYCIFLQIGELNLLSRWLYRLTNAQNLTCRSLRMQENIQDKFSISTFKITST